jgi:hypothetical protein
VVRREAFVDLGQGERHVSRGWEPARRDEARRLHGPRVGPAWLCWASPRGSCG